MSKNDVLKRDIYIGRLKKCLNLYNYRKYGDVRYIEGFKTYNNIEIGTLDKYTEVIKEEVILVKIDANSYVCIDDLNGILDDFLLSLGLSVKILKDYPVCDNGEFVCDLRPYFLEEVNDKVSIKKLKKEKKKKISKL